MHDRLAVAYFRQGARAAAIAQMETGLLGSGATGQEESAARESFWADFVAYVRKSARQKGFQ